MGEVVKFENKEAGLVEIAEGILLDARTDIKSAKVYSVPIVEVATLGAGVASLLPAMRTITETVITNGQGLYRLANAGVGDALKYSQKNGTFWGAFKTADGSSKMAQLVEAGPLSSTKSMTMPIDPATMMMAVALFSIEMQLRKIEEQGREILNFLEIEKEAEIEADVEVLLGIIAKYKHSWDNEHFITSNHKMVLDIQRTAKKNMISYQKKVTEVLKDKKLISVQKMVGDALKDLQKKFKYYRLSVYTYAMASFTEIILSGNFKEENISGIKAEIEKNAMEYRELFSNCSVYLETLTGKSIETNLLKGVGNATKAAGKLIGNIPLVKKGPAGEFLQEGGEKLKGTATDIESGTLEAFAEINDPLTSVFSQKMEDMIGIYNRTTDIGFDNEKIYLIAG